MLFPPLGVCFPQVFLDFRAFSAPRPFRPFFLILGLTFCLTFHILARFSHFRPVSHHFDMAGDIPRGGTPPKHEMDPEAELLPLSGRPFDPVTYRPAVHVLPPDRLRQFRSFDRTVPPELLLRELESHLSYGASEVYSPPFHFLQCRTLNYHS